ncbi:MAG: cation:proton antiporter, partial [Pseudomonadota bacterium]
FDRKTLAAAPAPTGVKRAVRLESAAIAAFGAPAAIFCLGAATAAGPGEPQLAPLFHTTVSMLKGFVIGGACGLAGAWLGGKAKSAARRWSLSAGEVSRLRASAAVLGGVAAGALAGALGGGIIVAAAAAGLLWSEETGREPAARRRLHRLADRAIPPAAYFAFGFLLLPRLAEADLLTVMFAVAATTILRAAPRLIALNGTPLPTGARSFLAWYGGAPGAGTALFLIMLTGEPAVAGLDEALSVGALCVACGVVGARASSKPLLDGFLQSAARGRRRAAFA